MTTLKSLVNLLPKLGLPNYPLIHTLIDRELRCLASSAPLGTLQEQLSMLQTLIDMETLPSFHNIDKKLLDLLTTNYMAAACEILTKPAQGTLEEQVRIIQQLVLLRQHNLFRRRLDYVDGLIRRKLDELDRHLAQEINGTLSEQISILSILVDFNGTLRIRQWAGDIITIDNIGFHIMNRIDHLRPTMKVKTEEVGDGRSLKTDSY